MFKKKLSAILAIPLALSIVGGQAPKASAAFANIYCQRLFGDFLYTGGTISEPLSFILAYRYQVKFSDGPNQSKVFYTVKTNSVPVNRFRHPNLRSQARFAQLNGTVVSTRGLGFVSDSAGCPSTF